MERLLDLTEWRDLKDHHKMMGAAHLRDLFAQDNNRFQQFSLQTNEILLDYSKNRINQTTLNLLFKLAERCKLSEKITALFQGDNINTTEQRPALHTALRDKSKQAIYIQEKNTAEMVSASINKMRQIVHEFHHGIKVSASGKKFTDVVNLGIGGSDLGPLLACEALKPYSLTSLRCHFVSNVDGAHLQSVLKNLNPETTLFIISSKSFTTIETLTNAKTAQRWLQQQFPISDVTASHFVAITAQSKNALDFGVSENNILDIWDWVGGRYSLWSAIGLPIALQVGMQNFEEMLAGAYQMDCHFRNNDFANNMPVILGLLGIWYHNFFNAETHAILPYDYHLRKLPAYLQQADMESNGKSVDKKGNSVDYTTGPIIWGSVGCNGQHAFHQLLHQGTHLVPTDFIIAAKSHYTNNMHHQLLFATCLSQTRALMLGKTLDEAIIELRAQELSENEIKALAPHKVTHGNIPSNTLLLNQLTPVALGELIALYEHKIFVQSVIWNINSFDQWGVELGKQIANEILPNLTHAATTSHDTSTDGLINYYQQQKTKMAIDNLNEMSSHENTLV